MYKTIKNSTTSITINRAVEGETIEMKMRRITQNKEPIKDGAPPIYTARKDGVNPNTNIRTDKWEYAVEAKDYITRKNLKDREERHKPKTDTPGLGDGTPAVTGPAGDA